MAKTKKFNKAQVELRLANRVKRLDIVIVIVIVIVIAIFIIIVKMIIFSWGKLMKNKKNNSASTFADALEAMNEATGNGKGENCFICHFMRIVL